MAAGNCAEGVSHRRPARRRRRRPPPQQQQQSTAATATAATAWQRRVRPHPPGVIPCNLRRHTDAICILAKAQPRVVKQLGAGADKDLINTLSECAANILNGNMILQPHQKQRLSRHADALRALRRGTVSQRGKKALLMDGGFVGLLASTVAPLLFKAVPSIVSGVGSLVRRLKRRRRK